MPIRIHPLPGKLVFVEVFARSALASPGGKLSSEARLMRIGDI